MAEKLESFNFQRRRSGCGLDKWLDGTIWKLSRSKDFCCNVKSLVSQCHKRAGQLGKRVRTQILSDKEVVLQSYVPSEKQTETADAAA